MSDDLISRQGILKHIEKIRQGVQMMDDIDMHEASIIMNGMHLCEEAVRNQPSAQPERKKGKWIERDVIYKPEASKTIEEWQSAKCSVCGKYHTTSFLYYFENYNFCPHCGARMEGQNG